MRASVALLGLGLAVAASPATAQMQPRDLEQGSGGVPQQAPTTPPPPPYTPPPQPRPPAPPPPQAAPAPAPSGNPWQTLETANFGQWTFTAQRHAGDGSASCAVHTHWHDTNRQLRIVVLENPVSINIALMDPRWNVREGASTTGSIQIDGQSFTAEFQRIAATVLSTRLASGSDSVRRFIAAFRAGNTMRVTLPGDAFVAGLRGTSVSMDAMSRCINTYFGRQGAPASRPPGK